MQKNRYLAFVSSMTGVLLTSQLSFGAAFQFYELGAPINGTAAVGQAAVTSDASISYYNPAGMTRLNSTQFLLGAQTSLSYTNFSPNSANTIRGNNGSNAGELVPGADAYFVYNFSPKLKMGASLTTPYGGALNYDNHWVGRYNVQQLLLLTLNLNPSLAYQVTDWFALGAGIAIEYANLYQTVALPITPLLNGQATVKVDNTATGFNLGILLTPAQKTQIGFAYRSQIIHHLGGSISFENISTTPNATTKLVMPANIIGSISQGVTENFTLLGEAGWANWSSMTDTIIHVAGYSAVTPQNWHNTYRFGLGGYYTFTPAFLLQAGVSYDSSPTSSSKRLPDLPMDRQIRAGVGLQYALIRAVKLGLSYEFIDLGSANIHNVSSNGVLAGSYSRNNANILQASLNVDC